MFGIVASLLGLSALIFTLMDGSHFPVIQWPYEAYQGLVFSFVWGFGVSATVGYLLSILVFIGVAVFALQWVIKYHVACLGEANFSLEFIHITNASRGTVNA